MTFIPIAADSSVAELLQASLAGGGGPGDIRVVMLWVVRTLHHTGRPQPKWGRSDETCNAIMTMYIKYYTAVQYAGADLEGVH